MGKTTAVAISAIANSARAPKLRQMVGRRHGRTVVTTVLGSMMVSTSLEIFVTCFSGLAGRGRWPFRLPRLRELGVIRHNFAVRFADDQEGTPP